MKTLIIAAATFLWVTAFSAPAYACSCGGAPIEYHFQRTDSIFVGEVVAKKHNENRFLFQGREAIGPGTIEITFKVTRAVKGTMKVGDTLTVQTSDQGSACGITEFATQAAGASWIVYAQRGSGSVLQTGSCSRTKLASTGAAIEDTRYFDSLERSR